MNFLKLLLALGSLVGLLSVPAPSGDAISTTLDLGPKDKIEFVLHEVAPTTPNDRHKVCPPVCPPFC